MTARTVASCYALCFIAQPVRKRVMKSRAGLGEVPFKTASSAYKVANLAICMGLVGASMARLGHRGATHKLVTRQQTVQSNIL